MTILIILAVIFVGGLLFCAGLGYGISRSLCEDDYEWEDEEGEE
jgi:hypothetical protein